ncbi:MAG: hypothetical protein Q4A86_05865 [Clostridia bacterium]|nr:hypothetical protein [Clostridia bacterium]
MGGGILGSMFDFNNDGEMSAFESAAECMFFHEVIMKGDKTSDTELDFEELSLMDRDERRAVIEDAGLDPDDFDDFDF